MRADVHCTQGNHDTRIADGAANRARLIAMNINALIGYLIVEINAAAAHFLGLSSIRYDEILLLSALVNGGTLLCLAILNAKKTLSAHGAFFFFIGESMLFFIAYSMAVYTLNEIRLIGLVFALVAIIILLPFTSYKESLFISIGATLSQIGVAWYAIMCKHRQGSFTQDLFYIISCTPVLIIISYVAHQMSRQKKEIHEDRILLGTMNNELRSTNEQLAQANTIARHELKLAGNVQRMILPPVPVTDDWEIAVAYMPKYGASGDFYDFYLNGTQLRGMSLFDVSGHGVSAALITMIVKPIVFKTFTSMNRHNLTEIVSAINRKVSHDLKRADVFVSGIILRCDGPSIEYVNAGHPDLLHRIHSTAEVRVVGSSPQSFRASPIGLQNIQASSISLTPDKDDLLLLYTDGIFESINEHGELYGQARVIQSLKDIPQGSCQEMLDHIMQEFLSFVAKGEIRDDYTVLLVRKR